MPLLRPKALLWVVPSFLFGYFFLGSGVVLGSLGGGPAVLLALGAAPPISCLLAAGVHRGHFFLASSIAGTVFAAAAGIRLYLWSRRAPFPENPQLGRHVLGLLLLAMPLYLLWGAALRSSLRWLDGRSELRRARFALILALGYGAYIAAFALWVGRG